MIGDQSEIRNKLFFVTHTLFNTHFICIGQETLWPGLYSFLGWGSFQYKRKYNISI